MITTVITKDGLQKIAAEKGNGNGNQKKETALVVTEKKEAAPPAPDVKKEMTLIERIMKIENLQLIVDKRGKMVQTKSELERFQIASNDFNCTLRMNDSDGNTFTTSFTPGIKKVIGFLLAAFDASIAETEEKINF